jgi:hypothetical protein
MPVLDPSEFLAFGVTGPSNRVHFVARGRLKEQLAAFITRMAQGNAQVELYVRAPVPVSFLVRYASSPPIEGQESEEPAAPPVRGLAPGPAVTYSDSRATALWPGEDASPRSVLLTPTHEPAEFLALGLVKSSGQVLFRLTGSVQLQLGELVTRLGKDGARVELRPYPPAR